jgi:hypothetical protein
LVSYPGVGESAPPRTAIRRYARFGGGAAILLKRFARYSSQQAGHRHSTPASPVLSLRRMTRQPKRVLSSVVLSLAPLVGGLIPHPQQVR